jgi:hypothetical protein
MIEPSSRTVSWSSFVSIAPLAVSGALSLGLVGFAWRRRRMAGALAFALMMLAVAEWSVAYALVLLSDGDISRMLFWFRVEWIGVPLIGPPG